MYGLIRVCEIIYSDLILMSHEIISFLNTSVTVLGVDYTYLDLMFGLGLPVVLALSVAKWLIGIVT